MFHNYTLVCINPDTTPSVFFVFIVLIQLALGLFSLHVKKYVSIRNKAKLHIQLIYILGFKVYKIWGLLLYLLQFCSEIDKHS